MKTVSKGGSDDFHQVWFEGHLECSSDNIGGFPATTIIEDVNPAETQGQEQSGQPSLHYWAEV